MGLNQHGMMVNETTGPVSASTAEIVGASPSIGPVTQQLRLHEEPLMKSTAAKHRLKFASSGTRLWKNINRKRSASYGSFRMASSNMADELIIEDSNIILQDSVQLTNCLQTHQRYLFLLSNVLVIAKQKSPANFHVKDEIRLCEIWLSDCVDQVSEVVCDRERSFVIGWPTVNVVATFASVQIRDVWLSRLQQQIAIEKAQEWPSSIVIRIINTSQAFSVVKSLLVQNFENTKDVVIRCVQDMHIASVSVNDFQFWVQSEKENHPYPLIGHEFPYAIQMNYIRAKQSSSESAVLTDISLHDGLKFQIVPKQTRSKLSMKLSLDETRRSPKKTSKIVRLFKKSSRSVEVGNIFGHHLSDLFDGNVLCALVMDILSHLFVHGPATVDIFRKSAIVSKCHEAKQHLDQGDKVDFNNVHVGVSAALLKELLRCLPNCLLLCELYSKWIKISAVIGNKNSANNRLKSLIQILPPSHQIFLRYLMCILYRISLQSDHNGMTAYSLSICISPSLLWPRSSSGAALSQVNDAKKLNAVVEQMIACAEEIFGPDCLHLFDHLIREGNQSLHDVGVDVVVHAADVSLDIVKEESLVGRAEQDIDSGRSVSVLGLQSPDITPTSTGFDSGLATSSSVSYNDLVVMTALRDCPSSADDHSSNDMEPGSSVTPNTSVNCISRMDAKKCKFQDVSGWFHLAFEDDTPFHSPIEDGYPAADRVCESLPETCSSGARNTSINLSADFDNATKQVTAGLLKSLNSSNAERTDKMQSLVGAEPAKENAGNFARSSSLDESWTGGISMEQENMVKIDDSLFEVEQSLLRVDSETDKSSALNLRNVCPADGFDNHSAEALSSRSQSLPSADLPKHMMSNTSDSCDMSESKHISRREEGTLFLTGVEQHACLPEQGLKIDDSLCSPLSVRGILRTREQTDTRMNPSASSLNLRRGMTKCGSDIFPKYFLDGLHCTFGDVILYNRSEDETLTGRNRAVTQTRPSSAICAKWETPRHAMVRPPAYLLSKGRQFNSLWRPMAPSGISSGNRVRPARPPSYEEAIAAKVVQGGTFDSSVAGQKGFTSHPVVMERPPVPSTVCAEWNEESCFNSLPSDKNIIGYASCDQTVSMPTVTAATHSIVSHALQSVPSGTSVGIGIQSIPSISSKQISTVSTNSETVALFEQTKTPSHCGAHESKPLSIQNPEMPSELLHALDILPHEPSIASTFVCSDYPTRAATCLSHTNSSVSKEDRHLQTGVCAFMAKQRFDQKVKMRKRRQRSTDPKLRSCRAFGRGIGRSKSDSSEILAKKRQEYNSDEDKENVLVPSNSFLKRKLAAMKRASKEEELSDESNCSKCTVSYHLSRVSEENSAYADDAERESAYSPRDMKKKKSLLLECRNWQNEEISLHPTSLHDVELSDSLQHKTTVFHEDEFSDIQIQRELPLYSKTFSASRPMLFKETYCLSESIDNTGRTSSEQHDSLVLKSSSTSAPPAHQHPYVVRSAKLPLPDAIKINWSVSKLKQMYSKRSVSQSDSAVYPPTRMVALHDSPYFV